MQLPKYHETFLPILTILSDGKVIRTNELHARVRDEFYSDLPTELLAQKTTSGDWLILNRIAWGKSYLKQAEMVSQPERGMIQITEKGRKALRKGVITLQDILHDGDFLSHRKEGKPDSEIVISESLSPQDLIDSALHTIEKQVKADLLDQLKIIDPYYFQRVVLKLLTKMGYGDFIETPKSGDGGIDGIVNQDQLGLEKIYIQAKRYNDSKVREGDIRNFIGAMSRDTNKGIFVTTSSFDPKAERKAHDAGQKIILIDGILLVDLMYRYDVGVQVRDTYQVKQVDGDFFEQE